MSENRNTKPINKLKSIILVSLLFIFLDSFSQTNNISVSPLTLDVEGGINVPTSDFKDYAKNGYQVGLMLNKGVYKNFALGVSANYNHFGLKDNFESPDNAWNSISLGVGPQYTLPINMFFIQLYGHIGMSLIKTPGIAKDAENIPDYIEKFEEGFFNTLIIENDNPTGFYTDVGIKLGVQLSSKVRLFVGSSYSTSLNSPIKYSTRDISKAFHPSGEVDMDMIRSTPFDEKGLSVSSFNVNAGVSINLGKTAAAKPAQDYNSSRSNRPTPIAWTDAVTGNDTVPGPLYAQDYNSSRSNKPSPIAWAESENDTVQRPAQDYNSSRSNRPTPIAWTDTVSGNDSVPRPLYAQDYNSSRSNKPSPIAWAESENDTVQRPAQDYNSSRSNRPTPIAWTDTVSGNDSVPGPLYAQDYNSSRSNKPSPIAWAESENDTVQRPAQDYNSSRSNRPKPIAWTDTVAGNDTVPGPLYAQDYNSSRSNKPSPLREIDDTNANDSVSRPAQDYNSSRSNRPTPIRVIDDIKDINNDEDDVVVIGKLIKIDLKSRSFELIDKNEQKIIGQFQPKVTNEEINILKRDFFNKQVNIYVKINKTKLETGKEVISYEL